MHTEFANWKNQYIDLVTTKPDLIVSLDEGNPGVAADWLAERSRPYQDVICELGSGSGGHLVQRAGQRPNALFVGFEIRFKRAYRTAEKAESADINNLVIARTSARHLHALFPAGRLAGVYVNFPDPWQKRRWKKHRLLQQPFLQEVLTALRPDGFFAYKTDHPECFEETVKILRTMPGFVITEETHDLHHSPYISDNIISEFEALFLSQHLPIHFIKAKKS